MIHSAPTRLSLNEVQETCIACFLGGVGSTWQTKQRDLDYERHGETPVGCGFLIEVDDLYNRDILV